ncbi:head-tail connector protein [Mesorhizobium sp. LHD-90]|uniref:head-tail connector protein n=1 Tax=Mesorhizobium sp. LHD-90 TaxID=3071414 RepID=UPI0027E113B4|nr:head-tail connector protein [Mesorhizobium sp. LHD-90]MDQ6436882.1 head-tail connector protein [Mesorhizobium sp. LHD-90]
MTLVLTGAPEAEPVTVSEAKSFLRLAGSSEDTLIEGLIRAAREDVERATGLALIDQTWRLALDAVPRSDVVLLMRHPVREIIAVTAYGTEGEAALVSAGDYQADLISRPARLFFRARPEPMRALNGLEIDFRAGFGEAGPDVPDLLRRAILVLVAHWYEFRASFGPDEQPVAYPPQYERMIAAHRDRRL